MPIIIKTDDQINKMKIAGNVVAKTLLQIEKHIKVGISTFELDQIAYDCIKSNNAIPSFKGYNGFPSSICASINEEVIHGIPSKKRHLKDGDIISVDVGAIVDGYHGDAARTFMVGSVSEEVRNLVLETEKAFFYATEMALAGEHLYSMSGRIEEYVSKFNYGVVREYVGHGIGRNLHEAPEIPNYIQKRKGVKLEKGMTLAIEPMINMGTKDILTLDDGWTVITKDKLPSAHYENTIVITDGKPMYLTLLD